VDAVEQLQLICSNTAIRQALSGNLCRCNGLFQIQNKEVHNLRGDKDAGEAMTRALVLRPAPALYAWRVYVLRA
jgi:xanthine dehydrogenase iron-sulfur cluster and FAD-binding subunit A